MKVQFEVENIQNLSDKRQCSGDSVLGFRGTLLFSLSQILESYFILEDCLQVVNWFCHSTVTNWITNFFKF